MFRLNKTQFSISIPENVHALCKKCGNYGHAYKNKVEYECMDGNLLADYSNEGASHSDTAVLLKMRCISCGGEVLTVNRSIGIEEEAFEGAADQHLAQEVFRQLAKHLSESRCNGKSGWYDREKVPAIFLAEKMRSAADDFNLISVIAYASMLLVRGDAILKVGKLDPGTVLSTLEPAPVAVGPVKENENEWDEDDDWAEDDDEDLRDQPDDDDECDDEEDEPEISYRKVESKLTTSEVKAVRKVTRNLRLKFNPYPMKSKKTWWHCHLSTCDFFIVYDPRTEGYDCMVPSPHGAGMTTLSSHRTLNKAVASFEHKYRTQLRRQLIWDQQGNVR